MTEEQMLEAFERDHGKLSDDIDMLNAWNRNRHMMLWAWQARAARMVPDAAVSILADVINALENGFVRCETCGDQDDTATLDCMDDLRRIHYMLSAAPEGKK